MADRSLHVPAVTRVVHAETQHDQPLASMPDVVVVQHRHLVAAGAAPRRPQVDDHDVSARRREIELAAVEQADDQGGCGSPDLDLGRRARPGPQAGDQRQQECRPGAAAAIDSCGRHQNRWLTFSRQYCRLTSWSPFTFMWTGSPRSRVMDIRR